MKLSEYAKKYGLTYKTAYNHFQKGLIPNAKQLPSGTIVIINEEKNDYGVILYARTSSSQNKKMLEDQANRLISYAIDNGYKIKKVVKEFGSGLNDERKKLISILKENKYDKIIVEHKDRLTRFGFNWFQILTGNKIEVINKVEDKDEDLTQDLISIIHSFSARLYGKRRSNRIKNKIEKEIKDNAPN